MSTFFIYHSNIIIYPCFQENLLVYIYWINYISLSGSLLLYFTHILSFIDFYLLVYLFSDWLNYSSWVYFSLYCKISNVSPQGESLGSQLRGCPPSPWDAKSFSRLFLSFSFPDHCPLCVTTAPSGICQLVLLTDHSIIVNNAPEA